MVVPESWTETVVIRHVTHLARFPLKLLTGISS